VTSALDPTSVRFTLDGSTLATASGSPWSTTWNSAAGADGQHVVAATVTDGRGKTSTDSATVTVDNTPPSTFVIAPSAASYATGTLPVQAQASDAYGIAGVQFAVDGVNAGAALTQADAGAPYTFSSALDVSGLAAGRHTLTVVATDAAGNKTTSAGVDFVVGFPPPSILVTTPPTWTFARGVVPVTTAVAGGTPPLTVRLVVDGLATTQTATTAPFVFQWDTTKLKDGMHTVSASVVDAQGRSAAAPAVYETIDNTAPAGYTISPTPNQRLAGTAALQVHASDNYGVKSVQFVIDGAPIGALLTAPDTGQLYVYSTTYDTNLLLPGTHAVAALLTDNAGNTTTLAAVPVKTGPLQLLPVLNYHQISPPGTSSIYNQTPAEADEQLAWLKANGYQSVTLEQYQQWLAGQSIGVVKPVLITVDDGLKSELAWDPLLQKYGFEAVMFVITGLADKSTPGSIGDPNSMSWSDIEGLAGNGRWQIAFHAGQYGHGDVYGSGTKIGQQSYQASCPYFYTCLSGVKQGSSWTPESVSAFRSAITSEVNAGIAELKQKVPSASLLAWAAPFNDAGQWTNLYNDPSGQVQAWLPGFMASKFPIVFTQTNPITYGQASGTVGALTAFNRHYRFEVHTDTTIAQFAAAVQDPAFAR
jgi:hypothetical protein